MVGIARRRKAGQAVGKPGGGIGRIVTAPLPASPEIMQKLVKPGLRGARRIEKLAA